MGSQTGNRRRLAGRLIAFYVILAAVTVAVVVVVVDQGRHYKAAPTIAGGYVASAPTPCLGKTPVPIGGAPLPPTAPALSSPAGPAFNVQQSGQFVNFTNNQGTLTAHLRLHEGTNRLTGTVNCVGGKKSEPLDVGIGTTLKRVLTGTLGGVPLVATFKSDPPVPGTSNPRIPPDIQGTFTLSPTSTCFGSSFIVTKSGSGYTVVAKALKLGRLTYSKTTGAVFGDVACTQGGHARLTAVANDILLQNVQVIPLDVATPLPTTKPGAKPVLTTPSGLGPAGEKFTATKQRADANKLVAAVFLAIVVVLIVARFFGILAVKIGQPRVMGEVIAGIVLGPSVLGLISANVQAALFPTDTLTALGVIANLGLIFYMFLVGLEIDRDQLKGRAGHAAAISNASVAVPMMLGLAIALPFYKLLGPNKKFIAFAIFMGVAMSITAFPVLARILAERRMLKRPLGALAISCAAIDDVTAWFLIALATSIAASGSFGAVAKTIGYATAFALVMLLIVRRVLTRMATAYDEAGRIPSAWFAAVIVGVLLSAYVTETINIAFIFGGFMMGLAMPRHARLTEEVTRRIEDFVVTLLLPVFFVYTGLRTNVGLIDRGELWLITLALIGIAIAGKLFGAAIAARVTGFSWRESAVIGTLMNTRGLTELIVLNLALSLGVISNVLFTALVLMAVVTTLMAGPLLRLLDPRNLYGSNMQADLDEAARTAAEAHPELRVPARAILVASQTDGALSQLVALAQPLAKSRELRELIIARPVLPSRGTRAGVRVGLQTEELQLRQASAALDELDGELAANGVATRTMAFTSLNVGNDLVDLTELAPVDLVMVDGRRRLIGESVPFGDVGVLLEKADCDAAVLVASEGQAIDLGPNKSVLVPFGGAEHDWAALELGSWLAASTGAELKLLGAAGQTDEQEPLSRMLADAGLLVQQATGLGAEPIVAAGGREGILAAAAGASLLVIGLSDRWRREGLGPTRSDIAKAAPAPVLFVRRGTRPGLFAPHDNVTQFKWSMAGMPSQWSGGLAGSPASEPVIEVAPAED